MGEDVELREAHRQWLATRPKTIPRASKTVLASAERRLLGSIKHHEPRAKLVANAERVRRAQLGFLKASDLAAELPTDADDEPRARYRANVAAAKKAWETVSVDTIIEWYTNP